MKTLKTIKYIDIKNKLIENSLEVISNISDDDTFSNIKTITNSSDGDLSFFSNLKYLGDLKKTKAKACLIENQFTQHLPNECEPIIVNDPYLALALISNLFNDQNITSNGIISKNSSIDSKSIIEKNVQINPFSIVRENTKLCQNV